MVGTRCHNRYCDIILTFVQVILGEIVPKRMAMRNPEKVCYTFIGFLSGIAVVMRPFVSLLTNTANLVVRMFGVDPHEENPYLKMKFV